jgi:hypothetical protein
MTEAALRTKGQIWRDAHASRTECPGCGKFLTLRTLRWKHVCGERTPRRRLLDESAARKRLEGLTLAAVRAHELRMREKNGASKRGADQVLAPRAAWELLP